MDANRFDSLTRLVSGTNRRSVLRAGLGALFGGVLAVVTQGETDAAKRFRANGQTCRAAADCESNQCGIGDDGRRRCGVCPAGKILCGTLCVDAMTDRDNCGACGNTCLSFQSCTVGACVQENTCPADNSSDFCSTGNLVTCNESSSCRCYQSTTGATFCGSGQNSCVNCNSDSDCYSETGPGSACVELGTQCSVCYTDTPTHVCMSPCEAANPI